jgi:phage replication O-like protein O
MADQPTFTRIPNDIIEAMPSLGNAELRVLLAIARKTHGWQKRV